MKPSLCDCVTAPGPGARSRSRFLYTAHWRDFSCSTMSAISGSTSSSDAFMVAGHVMCLSKSLYPSSFAARGTAADEAARAGCGRARPNASAAEQLKRGQQRVRMGTSKRSHATACADRQNTAGLAETLA